MSQRLWRSHFPKYILMADPVTKLNQISTSLCFTVNLTSCMYVQWLFQNEIYCQLSTTPLIFSLCDRRHVFIVYWWNVPLVAALQCDSSKNTADIYHDLSAVSYFFTVWKRSHVSRDKVQGMVYVTMPEFIIKEDTTVGIQASGLLLNWEGSLQTRYYILMRWLYSLDLGNGLGDIGISSGIKRDTLPSCSANIRVFWEREGETNIAHKLKMMLCSGTIAVQVICIKTTSVLEWSSSQCLLTRTNYICLERQLWRKWTSSWNSHVFCVNG